VGAGTRRGRRTSDIVLTSFQLGDALDKLLDALIPGNTVDHRDTVRYGLEGHVRGL